MIAKRGFIDHFTFVKKGEIYWHFRSNAWIYSWGVGIVVALVLLFSCSETMTQKRIENKERAKKWPLIEGTILEKEVTFVNTSDDSSFRVRYYVTLKVEYRFEGREMQSIVRGDWDYRIPVNADEVFQVGKEVPLRVDPQNPEQASLIELTGNL